MLRLTNLARTDLGRRMQRVLSAQMFNQVTTVVVQLSLVPILLSAWGTTTYGTWILLSAIPTYLTFSDLGFTLVAKNEMLMHVAAERRAAAVGVYHSVFALLNIAVPLISLVTLVLIFAFDRPFGLNLGAFPPAQARVVLLLLIANVFAYQYFLLVCGGVRCTGRYAAETFWGAGARLSEGAAICIVALAGYGLVVAAIVTFANRVILLIALYLWQRRIAPWLALGHGQAQPSEVRRLLKPAAGFMLMPIGQALIIQGPVIVIGNLVGATAVAVFSTTRTLTRFGTAATNMFNATVQGEYSTNFANGRTQAMARIFRAHQMTNIALSIGYAGALILLKTPLMAAFTHGKIDVVEPFFTIMVIAVAAEMIWGSIATILLSTNRHLGLATASLLVNIASVPCCYFATQAFGIAGAAATLLSVHVVTMAICWGFKPVPPARPSVAAAETISA